LWLNSVHSLYLKCSSKTKTKVASESSSIYSNPCLVYCNAHFKVKTHNLFALRAHWRRFVKWREWWGGGDTDILPLFTRRFINAQQLTLFSIKAFWRCFYEHTTEEGWGVLRTCRPIDESIETILVTLWVWPILPASWGSIWIAIWAKKTGIRFSLTNSPYTFKMF
jgi:hypothetical protein